MRPKITHEGREICSSDRWVIREVFDNESYLKPDFEIEEDDRIIDVGGHIGTFAIYAARRLDDGVVYTYEPVVENYRFLRKNVEENDFEGTVCPFNKAVSPTSSEDFRVYIDDDNTAGHGDVHSGGEFHQVDSITLEEIFHEHDIEQCDFLKIDCEGAEYEILREAPDELFERIEKIVMECHIYGQDRDREAVKDLARYLEERGFKVTFRDDETLPEASPLLFCNSVQDPTGN
jgi:FkbM family methyltransferase